MKLYLVDSRYNKVVACKFTKLITNYYDGQFSIREFELETADGGKLVTYFSGDGSKGLSWSGSFNPNPLGGLCGYSLTFYRDKEAKDLAFSLRLWTCNGRLWWNMKENVILTNLSYTEIFDKYCFRPYVISSNTPKEINVSFDGAILVDLVNGGYTFKPTHTDRIINKLFANEKDAKEYLSARRKVVEFDDEENAQKETLQKIAETEKQIIELQKSLTKLKGAIQ